MESIHYIGLDVHKKTIAYCIKTVNGTTVQQGVVSAERKALRQWLTELPGPWMGKPVGSGLTFGYFRIFYFNGS
jgi:hypothetical protein